MKNINNTLIEIRKPISLINFGVFFLSLIIGLWAYQYNNAVIEPNFFGININHFFTFLGGSSLVLWLSIGLMPCISLIKKSKIYLVIPISFLFLFLIMMLNKLKINILNDLVFGMEFYKFSLLAILGLLLLFFSIFGIVCTFRYLKVENNKKVFSAFFYTPIMELIVVGFTFIATMWFSIDTEIDEAFEPTNRTSSEAWNIFMKFNDIGADFLGFLGFLGFNIILYLVFYKKLANDESV